MGSVIDGRDLTAAAVSLGPVDQHFGSTQGPRVAKGTHSTESHSARVAELSDQDLAEMIAGGEATASLVVKLGEAAPTADPLIPADPSEGWW